MSTYEIGDVSLLTQFWDNEIIFFMVADDDCLCQ